MGMISGTLAIDIPSKRTSECTTNSVSEQERPKGRVEQRRDQAGRLHEPRAGDGPGVTWLIRLINVFS